MEPREGPHGDDAPSTLSVVTGKVKSASSYEITIHEASHPGTITAPEPTYDSGSPPTPGTTVTLVGTMTSKDTSESVVPGLLTVFGAGSRVLEGTHPMAFLPDYRP